MTDTAIIDMTPEQRFSKLDNLASEFFDTARWKTKLSKRYGITPQTVNAWKCKGAPVWAVQAMADALRSAKLGEAVKALKSVNIDCP